MCPVRRQSHCTCQCLALVSSHFPHFDSLGLGHKSRQSSKACSSEVIMLAVILSKFSTSSPFFWLDQTRCGSIQNHKFKDNLDYIVNIQAYITNTVRPVSYLFNKYCVLFLLFLPSPLLVFCVFYQTDHSTKASTALTFHTFIFNQYLGYCVHLNLCIDNSYLHYNINVLSRLKQTFKSHVLPFRQTNPVM